MSQPLPIRNPFGVTKANDLDDCQIQTLWVNVLTVDDQIGTFSLPNGYMPAFVLGGKGCGKTHLMRYHSFELQLLRYGSEANAATIQAGVERDGYLGIYALCGSINSSRFQGKGQSKEVWSALFAYYLELWLAHHLLHIVERLPLSPGQQASVLERGLRLFDKCPSEATIDSLRAFRECLSTLQRNLDFEVTNAVMTGKVDVKILVSPGKLLFGLPKILAEVVPFLRSVVFLYCIDEFENLTEEQQQVVNSLVRDKSPPSTLRIGSRLYGVKTHRTDGGHEENLSNSEYRQLVLDSVFRQHKDRYVEFAKELVTRRLQVAVGDKVDMSQLFETVDDAWNSERFAKLVSAPSSERLHMKQLIDKVSGASSLPEQLLSLLGCEAYPLLEKLNLLLFYQRVSKGKEWLPTAQFVADQCGSFLADPSKKSKYRQALEHYKSDLVAQLLRENGGKQLYLGLDTFISMSAGLPRALLTTLRSIFEWSMFRGEDPLRQGKVSVEAQYRGVRDATGWFFEHMRKAGDDGRVIQRAIGRLGQLFRLNRFAERPIEVSLSTFNVDPNVGSEEAHRVLRLAEERSFLMLVPDGGKDKNSGDPLLKYQISPMLAPRWDLPIARRGAVTLSEKEFNAVFQADADAFDEVLADWSERTSVRLSKAWKGSRQPRLI